MMERALWIALATLALGACSHMPNLGSLNLPGMDAPEEIPADPREAVRNAIEHLNAGEEDRARRILQAVLDANPANTTARRLMQQIETDPRELLGANARAHRVRAGETMSGLAERFLGDPLLFYALSRYNNLEAPNLVSEGQTLMIPQRVVSRAPERAAAPTPRQEAPPPVTAAAAPAADVRRAAQLRLEALELLRTGAADRAVALLQQAQALDGANPAIQRDLARALRIQASLRESELR